MLFRPGVSHWLISRAFLDRFSWNDFLTPPDLGSINSKRYKITNTSNSASRWLNHLWFLVNIEPIGNLRIHKPLLTINRSTVFCKFPKTLYQQRRGHPYIAARHTVSLREKGMACCHLQQFYVSLCTSRSWWIGKELLDGGNGCWCWSFLRRKFRFSIARIPKRSNPSYPVCFRSFSKFSKFSLYFVPKNENSRRHTAGEDRGSQNFLNTRRLFRFDSWEPKKFVLRSLIWDIQMDYEYDQLTNRHVFFTFTHLRHFLLPE